MQDLKPNELGKILLQAAGDYDLKTLRKIVDLKTLTPEIANFRNNNSNTPMLMAAQNNREREVVTTYSYLMQIEGTDINAVNKQGATALMVSAKKGHAEAVAYLLREGAEFEMIDESKKTAMDYASTKEVRKEIQNAIDAQIAAARLVVVKAKSAELCVLIAEMIVDPLMEPFKLQRLISTMPYPEVINFTPTPDILAHTRQSMIMGPSASGAVPSSSASVKMSTTTTAGTPSSSVKQLGPLPLPQAVDASMLANADASNTSLSATQLIAANNPTHTLCPLLMAVQSKRADIVQMLIDGGADPACVDEKGNTLLMRLVSEKRLHSYPNSAMSRKKETERLSMIGAILSSANHQHLARCNRDGLSILHIAAYNGYEEDCRMIINACRYWTDTLPALKAIGWNIGPSGNAGDDGSVGSANSNNSSRSRKRQTQKDKVVDRDSNEESGGFARQVSNSSTLSNSSASVRQQSMATTKGKTTKLAGVTMKQDSKDKDNKEKESDDDSSVVSASAGSAAAAAATTTKAKKKSTKPAASRPVVYCQLNNIVNYRQRSNYPYRGLPQQRARRGDTAMTLAARRGFVNVVRVLLEVGGADPNMAGEDLMSPLMWACWLGSEEMTRLLLQYGAIQNNQSEYGKTALFWAIERRHFHLANVLLHFDHGEDPDALEYWPALLLAAAGEDGGGEAPLMLEDASATALQAPESTDSQLVSGDDASASNASKSRKSSKSTTSSKTLAAAATSTKGKRSGSTSTKLRRQSSNNSSGAEEDDNNSSGALSARGKSSGKAGSKSTKLPAIVPPGDDEDAADSNGKKMSRKSSKDNSSSSSSSAVVAVPAIVERSNSNAGSKASSRGGGGTDGEASDNSASSNNKTNKGGKSATSKLTKQSSNMARKDSESSVHASSDDDSSVGNSNSGSAGAASSNRKSLKKNPSTTKIARQGSDASAGSANSGASASSNKSQASAKGGASSSSKPSGKGAKGSSAKMSSKFKSLLPMDEDMVYNDVDEEAESRRAAEAAAQLIAEQQAEAERLEAERLANLKPPDPITWSNPNLGIQNLTTPIITLCRMCDIKGGVSEEEVLSVLKLMIKRGAVVNARNTDGLTALMWATMNRAHSLMHELIDAGADPTIKDLNKKAAIDMLKHKDFESRVLLLEAQDNWAAKLLEDDNSYEEEVVETIY